MLYQERDSSAYLSQAQSSLVQWGLDGKLRTILDTIVTRKPASPKLRFSTTSAVRKSLTWMRSVG